MANPFLTNTCLKKLIKSVELDEDKKKILLANVPKLSREKREKLFEFLKDVSLLDLEEERMAEIIKKPLIK